MELPTITIEQFRRQNMNSGYCYRDNLIVTDNVENIDRFRLPCRMDGIIVLVCTEGMLDCSVNLKRYTITRDMMLINLPDDIIRLHASRHLKAYAVLISSALLSELEIDFKQHMELYLNLRQHTVCHLPRQEALALKPYYTLLCNNIAHSHAKTQDVIRGLVYAFSYTVISLMRYFSPQEEDEGVRTARGRQLFNQFMELVKQHHAGARGVKFYAEKLCLTPNYLSGVVKEYTGKTATEWVNEYVILEAKILLKDTSLSIQEIADKLNFSSQSAFGKYFKQRVGVGPRSYRNNRT